MNYLFEAIKSLKPTSEFSFEDNDYSTIKWDVLDGDAPTKAQIDAAILKVKKDEADAQSQKNADRAALLAQLGITEEQAKLLLG